MALGLALRSLVVGIVMVHFPATWLYGRGLEMGLIAKSLLGGLGFSSPFGGSTGPTAFIAPGYPLFVAAVFRVCGVETTLATAVILLAHTVANLLTVWLIMQVARTLFGQRAALVAGLIWACSLPLLWMPSIFWDTSFSACILMGAVAVAVRFRHNPPLKVWFALGASSALAGLMNPALLPSLLGILFWLAFQPPSFAWKPLALSLVTFSLVFSPWPIRNERVFDAFIPTRTTVGLELWMGNHDGATGYLDESLIPIFNPAELAEYNRVGEVAYTAEKSGLARTWIIAHPAQFLGLTGRRILRFWTGTGTRGGSSIFALHATCTTVFGLVALIALFRRREHATAMLFVLPALLFPLPYYITHAEFRYRLVIDPLMTVLAAQGLLLLVRNLRERRSRTQATVPAAHA